MKKTQTICNKNHENVQIQLLHCNFFANSLQFFCKPSSKNYIFCDFVDLEKNCTKFAMFFCNVKTGAQKICNVFALQVRYGFAMSKKLLCSFAVLKQLLCRLQLALHLGWWTHSLSKMHAKTAKLRLAKPLSK